MKFTSLSTSPKKVERNEKSAVVHSFDALQPMNPRSTLKRTGKQKYAEEILLEFLSQEKANVLKFLSFMLFTRTLRSMYLHSIPINVLYRTTIN